MRAMRWGQQKTDQPAGEGRPARPARFSRPRRFRTPRTEGQRFDLTDWRLTAGMATLLLVAAGLVAYALYRPGPAGAAYVVAGLITVLALLAVLLVLPRSLVAAVGYAGLLAVVGALFVRSQLRRGALAPPIEEWSIAVAGLCGAIALARVTLRALRTPDTGRPPSARMTAAGILAVLVLVVACLCMPGVRYLSDGADPSGRSLLSAGPAEEDLIPLPADTYLVQSSPGVYVFGSSIGAGRDVLAAQIVAHYLEQDWPLERMTRLHRDLYQGCRPVRGLITWHQRCMQVIVLEGSEDRVDRPRIPGTVNVYLK
jgi:hypothetical protein